MAAAAVPAVAAGSLLVRGPSEHDLEVQAAATAVAAAAAAVEVAAAAAATGSLLEQDLALEQDYS